MSCEHKVGRAYQARISILARHSASDGVPADLPCGRAVHHPPRLFEVQLRHKLQGGTSARAMEA